MNIYFVREWRLLDYVTCFLIALIGWLVNYYVQPYCRFVDFTDGSISYPRKKNETFPVYFVIIAVMLVNLFYIVGEFLTWRRYGRYIVLRSINNWVLVQAFSLSLGFCIVCFSKLYAGRLRPDFIKRLEAEGITKDNIDNFTQEQFCQAAREGRLSFPSGHSCIAFSGYVPLTLYLLGLTRSFRPGSFHLATLSLLPLVVPIVISISRTRDNYHHFADVLAGAVIGTFCGLFSVFISFFLGPKGRWIPRRETDISSFVSQNAGQGNQYPVNDANGELTCRVNMANFL